ncbi:GntR family transcriptional regulator [Roseibium album]|uniref:Putative HTH-type transcriptional regulator YidP n=1 Tax=Roseibium album TaxID=311410 RepID=A0A0M6ZNA6_9HYPH|nr:GntR family transcriptional regulator [Roseibium album]CTQ62913.1 putative HTH-type transcriptional regulator YidP [Roseibium album]CTQ79058.1 putative HTH-type transcriptional regulator YidP [Roseibium album]CTQ80501.1 putative HTH-type transcriptional regulator YidP [Roseibium album]
MNKPAKSLLPEGTKARQVYLSLRDQIADGRLEDGENLPPEQKLAELFGVSRVTVRRALDALAAAGLVVRRAGSGTTVRTSGQPGKPMAMNLATLMPQLVEMGQSTTARLLSFSYGAAPEFAASALRLAAKEQVQIATRVRSTDGIPFSHLTTYVPAAIAANYSENDLATTPLFKLLELSGVQIKDAHQSVSATLAGPDVAEALGIAVGSALLSLRRVVRDVNDNGVEYLSGLYRPDMFRLEMPLTRVGDGSLRHWEPAIGKPPGEPA